MPSLDRPGRWKPGAEASQHQRPGARPAEQIAGAGSKGRAEERKRKNDGKRDGRTARTAERWKLDRITDDGRSAGVGGRWKLDSRSQEQNRTRRRGARHWRPGQEQRRGDGETLEARKDGKRGKRWELAKMTVKSGLFCCLLPDDHLEPGAVAGGLSADQNQGQRWRGLILLLWSMQNRH